MSDDRHTVFVSGLPLEAWASQRKAAPRAEWYEPPIGPQQPIPTVGEGAPGQIYDAEGRLYRRAIGFGTAKNSEPAAKNSEQQRRISGHGTR